MAKQKPLVVVTRKLPDVIETRMMELFDVRLNLTDEPSSPERLIEAVRIADVLVPTVTDRVTGRRHQPRRRPPEADRQLRHRLRPHRPPVRPGARHHRHQHAGRADRGHRRHDHGADPGRAAAADRGRAHPARGALDRLVADLDARPSRLRQAAGHRRHGPDRPGGGAPRPRLPDEHPLPQPPPRPATRSRPSWRRPTTRASIRCWRGWT